MEYGPSAPLAATGATLGAILLDQAALIGVGLGAVIVGALLIRASFRRRKAVTEI